MTTNYPLLDFVIAFIGMILLGNATALWMIVLSGIFKALGQGAGVPAIQATGLKQIGRDKAGVVSSTCYIGQDIGNAIAPIIGGMVATTYGYKTLFCGYAGVLLVVGVVMFYMKTKYDEVKYGERV